MLILLATLEFRREGCRLPVGATRIRIAQVEESFRGTWQRRPDRAFQDGPANLAKEFFRHFHDTSE